MTPPRNWPETIMVESKVPGEGGQEEHLPGKLSQDLVLVCSTMREVSCSLRSQVREGDGRLTWCGLMWPLVTGEPSSGALRHSGQ